MWKVRYIIRGMAGLVLALVALVMVGLRIRPAPFPAYPEATPPFTTLPIPEGLPAPVDRFYRAAFGNQVPVITSAVITGRADLRIMGVTFPARYRFTHEAGRNYRHYIEATLCGTPLMRVNERYLDAVARLELPFGVTDNEPKVNAAANLGLWGEAIWFSPIFITDPRVRWEPIDEHTARLTVPFEDTQEDSFVVHFDPATHLITQMEALRWKGSESTEKTRWILDVRGWKTWHGVLVPDPSAVTWEDEGTPWLVLEISDIAFNVDVADYIRGRGL